ncbi:hypothetical protein [Streptomyces sp. NBC_01451]|uniref:hypothetical protein n=1 Tax=Streptomyces sp. NBC_01451 TaxID=2903872 RepID=UPI002E2F19F4|nr:hypothetical protein [Streptomyces sp. NBC_01451]
MSKAKRKARALASTLELSRKENRQSVKPGSKRLMPETLSATAQRLKAESQAGANVPARVVERMSGSVKDVRISQGDSGPKMRPKRKPHTVGREAAGTFAGRDYGSSGDGVKRLSDERIRQNRAEYFAGTAASRKAQEKVPSVSGDSEAARIAQAREDYAHAIGKAHARTAAGDPSGAEAWMSEARKYRRIFRNH